MVRAQARVVAGAGCRSARRSSSSRFPGSFALPATTTAARTTSRSGPIRPPAPWASRGKAIWASGTFPLVLQNVHRYFLYVALVFIFLLAWDAIKATQFADGFGIGVGTVILTANVCLLAGYTLGCHSLRHLVGGGIDQISKHPARFACYEGCSKLNKNHMRWAWASLVSVAFSDVYVRLCAMGIWTDWRIL